MEVKKYDKIVLDSSRSIDDIAAGIKAELSKQESQNAGESYICYVSHAYSSGDNAGVNYIVVSDEFKNLNGLSSNVIKASAYTKDEINELIARVEAKIPVDEANLATKEEVNEINSTLTDAINTINTKANTDAVVNLTGEQTIEGVKTFSMVPIVATQPTEDTQVANKAYVDSRAVSSGSGDATKASWGLNWAAGIALPNGLIIEAPSDGVVFLFVRRRMSGSLGTTNETFYFAPKNNNPRNDNNNNSIDPNSFINALFCKSGLGEYASVDSGAAEQSFFSLIPVTPNSDDGESRNYVSSLSSVPVRQGDQLQVDSFIIARSYVHFPEDNEYLLQAVFFPFEK
ncbi:hypothetical protein [Campylobacter lanienae]|uniref:hypothetical protein n=1 Tax=Campylobacter lanienae TaxID=75658 RepID=UPI000BB423DB|nr:hypothetical protein [Campylobacter lanienae]